MKVITREAAESFTSNTPFSKSNTVVVVHDTGTELALHGNCIASKTKDGKLVITNAGWFNNVTKERLNALQNVSVQQKRGKWYLNGTEWNGKPIEVN